MNINMGINMVSTWTLKDVIPSIYIPTYIPGYTTLPIPGFDDPLPSYLAVHQTSS
jgi:hypothetical protein